HRRSVSTPAPSYARDGRSGRGHLVVTEHNRDRCALCDGRHFFQHRFDLGDIESAGEDVSFGLEAALKHHRTFGKCRLTVAYGADLIAFLRDSSLKGRSQA